MENIPIPLSAAQKTVIQELVKREVHLIVTGAEAIIESTPADDDNLNRARSIRTVTKRLVQSIERLFDVRCDV